MTVVVDVLLIVRAGFWVVVTVTSSQPASASVPLAQAALKNVADVIREKAKGKGAVTIEGHTDAKGSETYNQKLSERRAESVKNWLVAREGLRDVSFTTRGLGATKPVASNRKPDGNDDPEGRQKNRRVEIVVKK